VRALKWCGMVTLVPFVDDALISLIQVFVELVCLM